MTEITEEIIAENKVERFVSRFESSYRLLACHAALPLVLTPELVNYLRVQFLKSEGVPWIAEADLLLSDLCRPVGYELYVMDEAVRAYLLHNLEQDERFGKKRIKDIASLLLNYVKHLAKINPFLSKKDLETQKWGAMLYLDTEQTIKEIARAISECVDSAEIARLLKITQEFKQEIEKSGQYQDFLDYAQVINNLSRRREPVSQEAITGSYQVAGLELTVPASLVDSLITTFKVAIISIENESLPPSIETFTFTVATIELKKGRKIQINRSRNQATCFIENLENHVQLEMVSIPKGTFMMGAPKNEEGGSDNERPQHKVTIKPFYMGKYPITQAQWQAVAALPQVNQKLNPNPSRYQGANHPVEHVNWHDAVEFCSRLSQHTGRPYHLPSEAEWEYACRAETTTPFHFGQTITTDLANYNGASIYGQGTKGIYRQETTEVGSFEVANNFGLYDMHGNVWEWCEDNWHNSYEGAPMDGSAWVDDNNNHSRMLRGGFWIANPSDCRSAYRNFNVAGSSLYNSGFRVACSPVWTQ